MKILRNQSGKIQDVSRSVLEVSYWYILDMNMMSIWK